MLIDDHAIVREGLKSLIAQQEDMRIVEEASDAQEALEKLSQNSVSVVLCDLNLPDTDTFALIQQIQKKYTNTKIIILSSHNEEYYILKAMEANVDGYLHKSIVKKELVEGIRKVLKGEKYYSQAISQTIINHMIANRSKPDVFTPREKEILKLISDGLSNKDIADKLFISTKTVETHRASLIKKADVKNSAELIKFAIENKII